MSRSQPAAARAAAKSVARVAPVATNPVDVAADPAIVAPAAAPPEVVSPVAEAPALEAAPDAAAVEGAAPADAAPAPIEQPEAGPAEEPEVAIDLENEEQVEVTLLVSLTSGHWSKKPGDKHICGVAEAGRLREAGFAAPEAA